MVLCQEKGQYKCDEYTSIIQSNLDYMFAGIFADQGLSGTQAKKRPEFMKMIETAKMGEIDLILTKSISRFARNTVDTITYVRELRELGVEVFFEKENISSLDPSIEFVLSVLAMHAEEESKNLSDNTKWSIRKKIINKKNLHLIFMGTISRVKIGLLLILKLKWYV